MSIKIKCIKPEGATTSKGIRFISGGEYDVSAEVAEYLTSTFPKWFIEIKLESPVVEEPVKSPVAKKPTRRPATKAEKTKPVEK